MAYKNLKIGGLNLFITANRGEFGFGFSFQGDTWKKIANKIRPNDSNDEQLKGALDNEEANPNAEPHEEIIWYHTIDLGNGVKTKGVFDHTPIIEKYKLPESFAGKKVLDVATFDGFWAFEFEKRGAEKVIALDLDNSSQLDWLPRLREQASEQDLSFKFGRGFAIAKEKLNSKVERVVSNVYDLNPETFGTFDVVHIGDVLLHLKNPVQALQNVASVCTDYAIISDVYVPELERHGSGMYLEYMGATYDYTWWQFSLKALEQMVLDAGFKRTEIITKFKYGGTDLPTHMDHVVIKAYK